MSRSGAPGTALAGLTVLVTRARPQAEELCRLLQDEGARPLPVPVMRLRALLDQRRLEALRARLLGGEFDRLVLTSANAVRLLLPELASPPPGLRVFPIGPGTARALNSRGWPTERLPDSFLAESLGDRVLEAGVRGRRVLLPRAAGARPVLPEMLRLGGAEVELVELYRMEPDRDSEAILQERLRAADLGCITFTSASSVACFLELAGGLSPSPHCLLACIGPVTAARLRREGLEPQVVAPSHSLPGLVTALAQAAGRLSETGGS